MSDDFIPSMADQERKAVTYTAPPAHESVADLLRQAEDKVNKATDAYDKASEAEHAATVELEEARRVRDILKDTYDRLNPDKTLMKTIPCPVPVPNFDSPSESEDDEKELTLGDRIALQMEGRPMSSKEIHEQVDTDGIGERVSIYSIRRTLGGEKFRFRKNKAGLWELVRGKEKKA